MTHGNEGPGYTRVRNDRICNKELERQRPRAVSITPLVLDPPPSTVELSVGRGGPTEKKTEETQKVAVTRGFETGL